MTTIRPSLALLVALAVVVAGAGSLAFVAADGDDEEPERPMGAEVSTFMQSSTADAGESVTTGMFVAGYEDGDEEYREAAVAERTAELEEKLEGLEGDHDRLADRAEASSLAYTAELTRLEAEIEALERAIDELEPRADEVGTETEAITELRTGTENLAESNLSMSGAEMTG